MIPLSRQLTDRERMWQLLELTEDPETGEAEWDWVDILLVILIMLSLVAVVLETLESFYERWHEVFITFELFVVAVFTVEYVLRLWSCTADPRYAAPVRGRVRYALSFFGIIDVLAILPFYAAALFPVAVVDLLFLRALRLVRFVRVLKLGRYSEATDRMKAVFLAKRADLGVALFMVFLVLIIASSVMYHIENPVQPEVFSSIPAAMWWGVSTLTTVGYGDVMPITPLGKLLGGIIQIMGIAFFALPAGILAAGYEEECQRRRGKADGACPLCGTPIITANPLSGVETSEQRASRPASAEEDAGAAIAFRRRSPRS